MGYDNAHPIAEVINAAQDEIAYSSFEGIHKGQWIYSGNKAYDSNSYTAITITSLAQVISPNHLIHLNSMWLASGLRMVR